MTVVTSDLKQRIIGAFYFVPIIIGTVMGQPFMGVVIGCLQALMCYELAKILSNNYGYGSKAVIGLTGFFLLSALSTRIALSGISPFALAGLLSVISFVVVMAKWRFFEALFTLALLQCLSSLSLLIALPNAELILVALALIVTAVDVAAYFVGRAVGGLKLAPSISPGKTISGGIGGLFGAVIMAFFMAPYIGFIHSNMIVTGIIIGVLVQAGDLYESAFKRHMNIKDSSNIIPGHGGFLDRFDGYIFIIPLSLALLAASSS